jgi:hypothetical protein
MGWRGFYRSRDQQDEDIVKSRAKNESKARITKGFREQLFCIKGRAGKRGGEDKTWAFIAAASAEQAVERAYRLRRELGLPKGLAIRAEFLESGPLCDAPYYANGYFSFLDDLLRRADDGDLGCPACGR